MAMAREVETVKSVYLEWKPIGSSSGRCAALRCVASVARRCVALTIGQSSWLGTANGRVAGQRDLNWD